MGEGVIRYSFVVSQGKIGGLFPLRVKGKKRYLELGKDSFLKDGYIEIKHFFCGIPIAKVTAV